MKSRKPILSIDTRYKYYLLVTVIIALAITTIATIWIIYKHKSDELDREIFLLN